MLLVIMPSAAMGRAVGSPLCTPHIRCFALVLDIHVMLCGFWYAGEVGALTSASKALLVALGLAEPQEQVFVPRMRLTIGKEARWRMQKAVKFRKKHGQCVPRSGQGTSDRKTRRAKKPP